MIEKLTPEQERLLAEHAAAWHRLAFSTEPADRPAAEKAARRMYRLAGLDPPKVLWFASPREAAETARQFSPIRSAAPVTSELEERVRRRIQKEAPNLSPGLYALDRVYIAAWDAATDYWSSQVSPAVRQQVGSVLAQIENAVRPVREFVRLASSLSFLLLDPFTGAQAAAALGEAAFYQIIGVDVRRLDGILDLARTAGWFWPFERVLVLSERPQRISVDDRGRPHALTGPAIAYPGELLYAVRSVSVPPDWIEEKAALPPETALTWPNIEQRRVAAEIIGWDRVLRELPRTIIHEDPDPEIGTLFEVLIGSEEPRNEADRILRLRRFLQVRCGTGRIFILPVPPEMRTARQANAWTYSLEEKDYVPDVRA